MMCFFAREFVFLCGFGRRVLCWLVGVPHGCCALVLVVFLLCLCCASVLRGALCCARCCVFLRCVYRWVLIVL